MNSERPKKPPRPLDPAGLDRLALFYVGRYATTRAKLRAYLGRKVRERGWAGEESPDIERLIERFRALGYIDDRLFAESRAASLGRRGFGARRIAQALHVAGIDSDDAAPAMEQSESGAWESAMRFAQRKRLGPFAAQEPDRQGREKAFAAMLRAGHSFGVARKVLNLQLGDTGNAAEGDFP